VGACVQRARPEQQDSIAARPNPIVRSPLVNAVPLGGVWLAAL
jgi:hypothetical protein